MANPRSESKVTRLRKQVGDRDGWTFPACPDCVWQARLLVDEDPDAAKALLDQALSVHLHLTVTPSGDNEVSRALR